MQVYHKSVLHERGMLLKVVVKQKKQRIRVHMYYYMLLFIETSGATIYYTVNGSKPEPFQTIGPAAKSTYKYRDPFRLPAGRRTVKAIAIGM